ncbi:hypothetical protein SAMN02745163_02235 [Clostridium cavendishii DSM 21758]|uniref:Uncharacterized protein n=1 Tax=Clostridium cavendishii DSM 21758 TaxID=1121302 RepID=A0A1M6KM23_9CLOT|nr:hypothetical protein [Clostridium cavendishii]SHJ59955.1 hypothetical protein SAMN02745163_02235 [Clostridium cavendishii DSM 21758]
MRLSRKEIFLKSNEEFQTIDEKSILNDYLILLERELFIHFVEEGKNFTSSDKIERYIEKLFVNKNILINYEKVNINNKKYFVVYSIGEYKKLNYILGKNNKLEVLPFQIYISKKIKKVKGKWDILIIKNRGTLYFILRISGIVFQAINKKQDEVELLEDYILKLRQMAEINFNLSPLDERIISNFELEKEYNYKNNYIRVVI